MHSKFSIIVENSCEHAVKLVASRKLEQLIFSEFFLPRPLLVVPVGANGGERVKQPLVKVLVPNSILWRFFTTE